MIDIKECCKYAEGWEYLEDHFDIEIHPPHTEEDEEYFTDIGTFMAHYAYKCFLQSVIEGINKYFYENNRRYEIIQRNWGIFVSDTEGQTSLGKLQFPFREYYSIVEAKESAINYVMEAMR